MESKQMEADYDLSHKKILLPPNSFYYDALDKLGYKEELLKKRVKIYDNAAKCLTRVTNRNWPESTYVIIPGSRGEGMAVSWNSDLDLIYVQPAVKGFDNYATAAPESVNKCVAAFELDLLNVPEGYTKLLLKNINWSKEYYHIIRNIQTSLTDNDYVKSGLRIVDAIEYGGTNLKIEGWLSRNYNFPVTTGPAQPLQYPLPFTNKYLSVDCVQAFPCAYPSAFDDWLKRDRLYAWPGVDNMNAVKETEVFVVSVGSKGSDEESLQWRISFTPAERYLVRSFNDTQIKVYAAMKMLVKHVLKPICDNITSYMIKNVIFWVFELRSGTFDRDDFSEILLQALVYLNECLRSKCLKNYFFPSRNLLEGKLSENERLTLSEQLNVLIEEGSSALLRCPLIKNMLDISEDVVERALAFREVSDKFILAFLSLEPDLFDELEHLFHLAESPEEILQIYYSRVLPEMRESNPFGFFTLFKTMEDEEIKRRMMEGLKLVDETWMD